MTAQLQDAFFGLFSGATKDTYGWLESLDEQSLAVASAS